MKIPHILILCAAMAVAPSCTSITADTNTAVMAEQGVPGGEVVKTQKVNATVTGIDANNREISLVSKYGEKFDVTAGPEVRNFNQIHIGDHLNVTVAQHLVIRMAKPGEKLNDEAYRTAGRAAVGAKPAAKMTDIVQYVATVTAIDHKKRTATLQFSDGSSGKFDVRQDIDLSKHTTGEKVLIRCTESTAVSVEKP